MTANELIEHYKGKVKAAAAVGVSVQTISNWEIGGIPRLMQLAIQTLTKNKLKADKE